MQKQPEPTPSPCLERPVGQNPHRRTNPHQEKQSLHQREKCARRIHSVGDGREGQGCSSGMEKGGTSGGPSHPQLLFSLLSQSWLGAVTLESWEQVPVLPSLIPFPEPFLPISYHVLLAQQAGGEVQKRVYTAQRGQSWEGPGQRPLPWGDQREIEPQTLWVHISAWEIQDDKSAEETGMGWGRVG